MARPAGPAPTTATERRTRVGASTSVVSRQARGLTRQEAVLLEKVWSRQAWLQAMQVLISSPRPAAALVTNSGSASSGRAIETRSAPPSARIDSASSGVLIRFDAQTGTETSALSRAVTERHAAGGTWVMIVGMRASCQPMPVLSTLTPASVSRWARVSTSSQLWPPSTRSSSEIRYMIGRSSPTRSRVRRTTSSGKRIRFSALPPHASSRSLVRSARNWLIR